MACREAVTEKIHGLCRKPQTRDNRFDTNLDGEYHTALHLPPFWWSSRPEPKWPWQCWSLNDYSFKSCKWVGCYQPCPCRQKDDQNSLLQRSVCRLPGHCGFHLPRQENSQKCSEERKQNGMTNLCCYCKLARLETNRYDEGGLPDPRCLGQYHSSLLENILGRGTALAIGKDECSTGNKDCSVRGYIPGDVHGQIGWSGCVGGDPMRGELNNSFFPFENSSTKMKLSKMSGSQNAVNMNPSYELPCQDHRYQYGIQSEQLCNVIEK